MNWNPFGRSERFDFQAIDPAEGTIYGGVRMDGPDEWLDTVGPANRPPSLYEGHSMYGYFSIPAPPEGTDTLTFDGDRFGMFPDVPVES
ncbi:hypothetical protein [Nocardiopsis halophila]|uniref:hypothetical protein n=1 Tax=Nocardiopsis halophila TaxID=141692 RepID=UPI00034BB978|nr:hypothetical protein [Nocardiopsis halophila]